MSPEQAEGRVIDGRSDLFSLGVVLYEMATARRPFTGETNLSILSSILKDTPRSVTDFNPTLPSDFGRIIRRALAKDPERRYQSAKDLRNDLEDLKTALDSGRPATQSPGAQAAIPAAHTEIPPSKAVSAPSSDAELAVALVRKHRWTLAAVAVLLLGAVSALGLLLRRGPPAASPEQTAAVLPSLANLQVTQLTTSGNAERPAISPDGRYVAYVQHDGDSHSLDPPDLTTSNVQIVAAEPA
jgi:serine/threonine-protein kinase